MLEIRRELSLILGRITKSGQQQPWSAELWLNFTTSSSTYLKYVFSVFEGNRATMNALYSELGKGIVPAHASDTGMRPASSISLIPRSTASDASKQRQQRRVNARKANGTGHLTSLPRGKRKSTLNDDISTADENVQAHKKALIVEPIRSATVDETLAHNAAFSQQKQLLEILIDKGTPEDKENSLEYIRKHAFSGVISNAVAPKHLVAPIVIEDPLYITEDNYDEHTDNRYLPNDDEMYYSGICIVGTCIYASHDSELQPDFIENCCQIGLCLNICYRECGDILKGIRICCQCRMR